MVISAGLTYQIGYDERHVRPDRTQHRGRKDSGPVDEIRADERHDERSGGAEEDGTRDEHVGACRSDQRPRDDICEDAGDDEREEP